MKDTVRVRRIESKDQLTKAYGIRARVFVKEQRVPEEIELDQDDDRAVHFWPLPRAKLWEPRELSYITKKRK